MGLRCLFSYAVDLQPGDLVYHNNYPADVTEIVRLADDKVWVRWGLGVDDGAVLPLLRIVNVVPRQLVPKLPA